jgi:hypothetical protein
MGLTKISRPPALTLIFLMALLSFFPLYSQEAENSLAAEIQNTGKKLGDSALSGAERHGVLLRLARLLHLSGNVEGAAQVWMEAAFAEQGKRDDLAMLEGAACFIALGELERAEAVTKTVLLTGRDRQVLLRARYTAAEIEAFKSGNPGALTALMDGSEYGNLKPGAYYTLWKIFGLPEYKARLLAEFPASPEGRIVRSEDLNGTGREDGAAVSASPRAMWFLFPGRESVRPVSPVPDGVPPAGRSGPADTAGPAEIAGLPPEGPQAIQTGLFGREENARAMAERLRLAGFTAAVNRRAVNGSVYWAVSVPPGPDPNATTLRLRDAGFEAFPVF